MTLIKRNKSTFPSLWNTFNEEDWFRLPDRWNLNDTAPAVNILETEDNFEVELAVPGMKKDDFAIDLEKNVLTISAEDKVETEENEDEGRYTRREFRYSSFRRSFTLPESANGDKITAQYKDGVLAITIPKKEEAKPKPPMAIKIK